MNNKLLEATNDIPLFSLNGTFCQCKVVDVYDGDTCKVVFPLNDKLVRWNVRLSGYDTPEMRPSKSKQNREQEILAAKAAKKFLMDQVMNNSTQLVYIKCGFIINNSNSIISLQIIITKNNKSRYAKKFS